MIHCCFNNREEKGVLMSVEMSVGRNSRSTSASLILDHVSRVLRVLAIVISGILLFACDSTKVSGVDPVDDETVGVLSSFRNGSLDGWTATRVSSTSNPVNGICGTIISDPGYLCVAPGGDGLTSYFSAPIDFRGDLTSFGVLKFRIQAKGGAYYSTGSGSIGDIVISSGAGTATYFFSSNNRPDDSWKDFSLSFIEPIGWQIDGASSLEDILVDVQMIQIRAEYGVGVDYTGLDDVAMVHR